MVDLNQIVPVTSDRDAFPTLMLPTIDLGGISDGQVTLPWSTSRRRSSRTSFGPVRFTGIPLISTGRRDVFRPRRMRRTR